MKREKWKVGDIFSVPQLDNKYCLAQILDLKFPNVPSCAFYDIRFCETTLPTTFELPFDRIIAALSTTREQLDRGSWQAIGLPDAFTDVNGEYALGVTTGWSGGVIPSLDGFMFVPGSRVYTNVNASIGNQDYLIVNTIAPAVGSQLQGRNLFLNWQGITGVTYQPLWSTNLVEWFPYGGLLVGSNGVMNLQVPVDDDPMKFFRVRSDN